MWVGCYTLDLYCDLESEHHEFKEFPHQYTDELGSRCRARARKDGWQLSRYGNGLTVCPKCKRAEAATLREKP